MAVCEIRESWLLARQRGLGGSDIAAVVGLSPFKRPIDIFVGKTQAIDFAEDAKEHLAWGNLLEPVIRSEYARRAQQQVISGLEIAPLFPGRSAQWDNQTIVKAEMRPWMLGTPDGVIPNLRKGLEIKNCARKGEGWGNDGSDEIPDHYMIQVQWYMAIMGWEWWDVAPLFSGNRLETYPIRLNEGLIRELIAAGEAFWNDNVLKGIPPSIDDSESYARYLARKYSLASGDVLPATDEITALAIELEASQIEKKRAEGHEQLLKNKLADILGNFQKSMGDFGSINWIRPKQGSKVNWEAVAKALNPPTELIAAHTSTIHNTPYIRFYPAKEK